MAKQVTFVIGFTAEALQDLSECRKFDQQRLISEIEDQLTHQPVVETRNRKLLRPNDLATWELRVDSFRVFYDVDQAESRVNIIAIGRKDGDRVIVHGEEIDL
jgi:mRNA-degrading endonuclease RelE of RelBE toxin-antitoxin system